MTELSCTQASQRLLVTPGEPAGIGPDVLLQWFTKPDNRKSADIIAIADPALLSARAKQLALSIELDILDRHNPGQAAPGKLGVIPCELAVPAKPGQLDKRNAPYVIQCLEMATDFCLTRKADGLVTGPVQKSVINDAGMLFSGHTEYLAEHCSQFIQAQETIVPVMMLATPGLRVALVTTHLALREVADQITARKVRYCLDTLHKALIRDFDIPQPRLLVAGLNPHAGENGHLGNEEINIISPVINECLKEGMHINGPLPADTLFTPKYLAQADAVLAMYHDQGLPVLKHLGFSRAVNITLGLPILRTSVDHGTALDMAGTGKASASSLDYAIEVAGELARLRHRRVRNLTQ